MRAARFVPISPGVPAASRSGRGFSPYDVAETAAWFSPRAGITLATSDVASWATQSPAGAFTAAQINGFRPTIAAGINGQPSVHFGGVQWLTSATSLLSAGATRYVLAIVKIPGTGGPVLTFRRGTRYWSLLCQDIGGNRYYFTDGVAVSAAEAGVAVDFTTPKLIEWELTAGSPAVVRVDGVARTLGINGNLVAEDGAAGFDLGSGAIQIVGDVGDVYIASGIPSAADKTKLRTYFSTINGITL